MALSRDLLAEEVGVHESIELPEVRPVVVRHRRMAVQCPGCGTRVAASPPAADQQCRMMPWRYFFGDGLQVQRHAFGIAPGQDQGRAFALHGADRAEDVGGRRPLVLRC